MESEIQNAHEWLQNLYTLFQLETHFLGFEKIWNEVITDE